MHAPFDSKKSLTFLKKIQLFIKSKSMHESGTIFKKTVFYQDLQFGGGKQKYVALIPDESKKLTGCRIKSRQPLFKTELLICQSKVNLDFKFCW